MGGRPLITVADALEKAAGPLLLEAIARSVHDTGRCRMGLCGGSTPTSTFAWLRSFLPAELYPALHITWVDERHLPLVDGTWHADSNAGLAWRHWLKDRAPAQLLPLSLGGALEDQRRRAAHAFEKHFDGGLDLSLLGVGADGHIASLFPGHPALERSEAFIALDDSPKPPPERISMSLRVLREARRTVLLARGAEKAEMLARAWRGDESLPLGRLQAQGDVHWVIDTAAAAAMERE